MGRSVDVRGPGRHTVRHVAGGPHVTMISLARLGQQNGNLLSVWLYASLFQLAGFSLVVQNGRGATMRSAGSYCGAPSVVVQNRAAGVVYSVVDCVQ